MKQLLLLLCVSFCHAGQGSLWLQSQVNTNGGIYSAVDLATSAQATSETLRVFHVLDPMVDPSHLNESAALDFLIATAEDDTETITRKLIAVAEAGGDPSPWVLILGQRQNQNGGFAHFPGYESTTLETAWALEALGAAKAPNLASVGAALSYLGSKQSSNGSWSQSHLEPSIYATAIATHAIWHYRHKFAVTTMLQKGSNYLLTRRNSNKLWGEPFLSALSLIALAPTDLNSQVVDSALALQRVEKS